MKLLLDQGMPRSLPDLLARLGFESVHVAELGLIHASDQEILVHAETSGSAVVTFDADFHAMLANSGAAKPSVIRIRIEGMSAPELADLLASLVALEKDILLDACHLSRGEADCGASSTDSVAGRYSWR